MSDTVDVALEQYDNVEGMWGDLGKLLEIKEHQYARLAVKLCWLKDRSHEPLACELPQTKLTYSEEHHAMFLLTRQLIRDVPREMVVLPEDLSTEE